MWTRLEDYISGSTVYISGFCRARASYHIYFSLNNTISLPEAIGVAPITQVMHVLN